MRQTMQLRRQNGCNYKNSQTLRMTRVEGFSLTLGLDSRGRLSLHDGRGRPSLHQHIYAITGLAAATGSTRSVSPSTWRTTMRSPAGTGTVETAAHSSPWKKTFPAGASMVWAIPIFPINPCSPVTILLTREADGIAHQNRCSTL